MLLTIHKATEEDIPIIYELTVALAKYERKTPDQILVSEEGIKKWGFGPEEIFETLIAKWDKKPVGFAVYFYTYASYLAKPILYLEDLFVLPESRGQGIGSKILQELMLKAGEKGCCRMQWAVFDWNEDAIDFYKKIGAEVRHDLYQVRLEVKAKVR